MIRNIWAVLCRVAINNKDSHNLSLVECLEKLAIDVTPDLDKVPFQIQTDYTLATFWHNYDDEKEHSVEVVLDVRAPNGVKLGKGLTLTLPIGPKGYFKALFSVKALQLTGPGRYLFIVRYRVDDKKRWQRAATIPVTVVYNVSDKARMIHFSQLIENDGEPDT